jgi:hypothetical protein
MADYEKITWYDRVVDQNGQVIQEGTPLSATNMNRMEEGIDLAANTVGAIAVEALTQINSLKKELDKWQNQRVIQGTAYIYNKYVIEGCVISDMPNSRYLQISRTGTYTQGDASKVYVDGKQVLIYDEQMIAMVPMGDGSTNKDYYTYIDYDSVAGRYKVFLREASKVPAGKLLLYKITVPATDENMDLSAVTITSVRRIEQGDVYYTSDPYAIVSLPSSAYAQINYPDYDVHVTVEDASDVDRVGQVIAYDKTANGFKLRHTGTADNVKVRWTILNPNIK